MTNIPDDLYDQIKQEIIREHEILHDGEDDQDIQGKLSTTPER